MCVSPFPQQPQIFYSSTVVTLSPQLTIYLGKRDFIDNIGNVEPVGKSTRWCAALPALNPAYPLLILIFSFLSDGVVLVDPAIIKGKKGLRFYAMYVSEIVCLSGWDAEVKPFYSFKGTNVTLPQWMGFLSMQCLLLHMGWILTGLCKCWNEFPCLPEARDVPIPAWLPCYPAACFTCPVLLPSVRVPHLRVPLWPGRHWCDWPRLPPGPVLLQGPGVPTCWEARVSHPPAGISVKEAGEKRLSLFLYSKYLGRASDSILVCTYQAVEAWWWTEDGN